MSIEGIGYTPGKWVNKFGRTSEIGTAPVSFDIWDGASITGAALYTYDSNPVTLYASADSGTINQELTVEGLDANYDLQEQSVDLSGQNQVEIAGTWRRVFRAYNSGSVDFPDGSKVYVALSDTLTDGVPDTATKIRAVVNNLSPAGDQQTLMALYTVPNGYVGFITDYYSSLLRIGQASRREVSLKLQVRNQGGVFRTQHWQDYSTDIIRLHMRFPEKTPIKVASKADIRMIAVNMSDDTDISAGFNIRLAR